MARDGSRQDSVPPLEWIAAAFGLAIALFILGALGWQALAGEDDPVPLLEVRVESVIPAGRSQVVTVRVTNASSRTAATVHLEGVLAKGAPGEETSNATIDHVPGHGEAKGALIFTTDPRGRSLDLRVTGYEHP